MAQRGVPHGDRRCSAIAAASLVAKVTRIRGWLKEGMSLKGIHREHGEELGWKHHRSIQEFVKSADYGTVCQWIDEGTRKQAERRAEEFVQEGRLDICELTPEVVAYLKHCLRRHPEKPEEWADDSLAQWAIPIIAKTTGLSEAPPQMKPQTIVPIGEIRVEIINLRASDSEAARVARAISVDTSPTFHPSLTAPCPALEGPSEGSTMQRIRRWCLLMFSCRGLGFRIRYRLIRCYDPTCRQRMPSMMPGGYLWSEKLTKKVRWFCTECYFRNVGRQAQG